MIKVITGPMKSGKSATLINMVREYREKGYEVHCYKPTNDTRSKYIESRNGSKEECATAHPDYASLALLSYRFDKDIVIAIDEFQFFKDPGIVNTIKKIAENNTVIISGLDLTSELNPFGFMQDVIDIADETIFIHGKCECCGDKSVYSKANFKKDAEIVIGDEAYSSVCRNCYYS